MKLVRKDIEKDNAGQVTLVPEEPEDMWHTYNLVHVGNSLRASTIRKVQTESSTGSVGSNRVRTTLTLCVEAIDFDSQACQLRVKGTNIQENEYVKMGAYHTMELDPNHQFTLARNTVVMQEGLAHICLVTPSMTLTGAKVEVNIPRKRKGNCCQHDQTLERFYEQVVQAIQHHINFDVVKCFLVASPGFVREQFCNYMFQQAVKTDSKVLLENRSKFLQIDTLLISDELFRHQDVATRSRYVRLVDSVKENAGTVRIFSSLLVSGEQLSQLTGVAAILRFPVPELSDQENDSSSDED
ncbi:Protein pelota-like protein [Sciurus carolinensis]|uniref:Protein pelota homolog n=1 Tax=Sciurus carolinensis TaxID=30640 RepID=A0AA41T0G9_SCICA|nr:Protein pelota-like protein [Sciurus carolinensis]